MDTRKVSQRHVSAQTMMLT